VSKESTYTERSLIRARIDGIGMLGCVSIFFHFFLVATLALTFFPQHICGQQVPSRPTAPEASFLGEEWNYTFHPWQSQDGLPEETVQAFAQTPDGYLWVGTSGGLLRFDGARFQLFAHENTPAFVENSVFCLLTARDGGLWIGTDGSGLIEMKDGRFQVYPTENGRSTGFIRALQEDRNGLIWVATDDGLFWAKTAAWNVPMKHSGCPSSTYML
jgi:ligand-binding sensor domain-containing protein